MPNITTIAIIEDSHEYLNTLKQVIELEPNFKVVKEWTSYSSFIIDEENSFCDIYLIDINLIDGNGLDLIQIIKNKNAAAKCLICSISEVHEHIIDAFSKGIDGYILKNDSIETILNSLKKVILGFNFISDTVINHLIDFVKSKNDNLNSSDLLTPRENELLKDISNGLLYKEISNKYSISLDTVKKHLSNAYKKLDISNKIEAINKLKTK